MLKIGIIGLNEGNGHPYSYSAIFNGYDPEALEKYCPFELIKQYLPLEHRNENFIEGAKVTHIWTQDRFLSENVSKVSLIPNIVDDIGDMVHKVDAVILARDDPWNHLKMAEPFIRHGLPLFIDKQLTSTESDLRMMLNLAGEDYPLMACSSARYTKHTKEVSQRDIGNVKTIHGVSRVNWMRYGHHVLEGIIKVWGTEVLGVQSLSKKVGHDIVKITFKNDLNVIIECIENLFLPIQFTCFSTSEESFTIPFTDYFNSFREMLEKFTNMAITGKKDIPYEEMVLISKIILAGDISKNNNGEIIRPQEIARI